MNAALSPRFPLALVLAVITTAALFSALNNMIAGSLPVPVLKPLDIDFGPQIVDTKSPPKRTIEKPVKEAAPKLDRPTLQKNVDDPRITARETPARPEAGTLSKLTLPPISETTNGSDRDVLPLVRITPDYPEHAAANNITGWVTVRYNISATGFVTDAMIVDSQPKSVFDKVALKAIERWRYNPKVMDGVAVERRGVETRLRFDLPDE